MLLLLLIIHLLTNFIVPVIGTRANLLQFSIEEKSPINTLVADLSQVLNRQSSSSSSYSYFEVTPLSIPLFSLDTRTGRLTTSSVIDREQLCARQDCACGTNGINGPCQIGLELIVNTPMMMTTYETIEIKIIDRNDHAPVFAEQATMHTIQIKENVPLGYRIVLPSASDPDEGLNAVQSYSLTGANSDDFDVDFSSIDTPYLVVRGSLDRRRLSSYSLTLTASDQGQQPSPRSGSTHLDIRILAVNDSVPSFAQSVYSIDVREDTRSGTSLLQIEATTTIDRHVTYQLVNDSPFAIDRMTGQLRLQTSLDYETQKSYRLTVRARDETAGSMPAYATVLVRVLDVNDNAVSIRIKIEGNTTLKQTRTNKSVLFVPEDTPVGTTLAHIILNDLDSFANGNPYLQLTSIQPPLPVIYKLLYQNDVKNTKLFSLILQHKLDRETKSIYDHIELIAHDSGTPALLTRLRLALNVTDVNDCVPIFRLNSTIFDVDENNPAGLIVGILLATDCDLGTNALLEYRLMNETDLLVINQQTGQISVSRSIDFEQLGNRRRKNSTTVDLEFQVQVMDHGQPPLSSQIRIVLRIHDLNDNSPRFDTNISYNWTIVKSALEPNIVLGRVRATDDDCGLQGIVHYSIRSFDPCLKLAITSLGFVYIVSSSITCSSSSHGFEITASDFGTPNPRLSTQLLTILIISDVNTLPRLPHLVSSSMQRTVVDVNTIGSVAFVLDLSIVSINHNLTFLPSIYLNNLDLSSCWNVTSDGEILLIARPFASSYILSLSIIDEFTQQISTNKLQIDLCNSSIVHSCTRLNAFLSLNDSNQNRMLLTWAIGLALAITCSCILIFSIVTCLCCRKREKTNGLTTSSVSSQQHQPHSFLQCSDDFGSEKTESSSDRFKSSSGSTIRDDDHDSACIINGHSSSSASSSGGIPHQHYGPSHGRRESTVRMYPSSASPPPPSTYFYDLKLAELLRTGQHPPCVHLNELPPPSQSMSTDYGFGSSELSGGSSCSSTSIIPTYQQKLSRPSVNSTEWNIEMGVDVSPLRQPNNSSSFISSRECVV